MDLRIFARALGRSWWVVLILVLVGAGYGTYENSVAHRVYASDLSLYVSITPGTASNPSVLSDDQSAQRRANSYVVLASSGQLADRVLEASGVDLTPRQIAARISASAVANTVVLNVTVKDTIPSRALQIARGVAAAFPALVNSLDDRGSRTNPAVTLNVVSPPVLHLAPVSPNKKLNLAIGVLGGLLLGVVLAVLREMLDTSVRSVEDLREVTGIPVFGAIINDRVMRDAPLVTGTFAHSLRAEEFRQIRTSLTFSNVDNPPKVIVITSASVSEGKSTLSTNLAIVTAESDARVLLIEGDLRRPQISRYLSLDGSIGLTDVLARHVSLDDALQKWNDGLTVLPSGSMPPNPSEILASQHMSALVRELRDRFDLIIIDTPPLLPVTDAAVAGAHADGTLLVVRHGRTGRSDVRTALTTLANVDAVVLGCVLNRMPARQSQARKGYGAESYLGTLTRRALPATSPDLQPGADVDGVVEGEPPRAYAETAPPEEGPGHATQDERRLLDAPRGTQPTAETSSSSDLVKADDDEEPADAAAEAETSDAAPVATADPDVDDAHRAQEATEDPPEVADALPDSGDAHDDDPAEGADTDAMSSDETNDAGSTNAERVEHETQSDPSALTGHAVNGAATANGAAARQQRPTEKSARTSGLHRRTPTESAGAGAANEVAHNADPATDVERRKAAGTSGTPARSGARKTTSSSQRSSSSRRRRRPSS